MRLLCSSVLVCNTFEGLGGWVHCSFQVLYSPGVCVCFHRFHPRLSGGHPAACFVVQTPSPGVSGGFVDCASTDGMRNAQWRRRFEWSKQLDSLNKQYFGNHSYRWACAASSASALVALIGCSTAQAVRKPASNPGCQLPMRACTTA
jgi:hypothetical protein